MKGPLTVSAPKESGTGAAALPPRVIKSASAAQVVRGGVGRHDDRRLAGRCQSGPRRAERAGTRLVRRLQALQVRLELRPLLAAPLEHPRLRSVTGLEVLVLRRFRRGADGRR